MIRKVIQIDEDKCTGCGICADACHEGAIAVIDGKARLTRDDYCDGMGDCLPACPADAIHFIEREADAYDAAAVKKNMEARLAAGEHVSAAALKKAQAEAAAAGNDAAAEHAAKPFGKAAAEHATWSSGKAAAEHATWPSGDDNAAKYAVKSPGKAADGNSSLRDALRRVTGAGQKKTTPSGFVCPGTAMKQFNRSPLPAAEPVNASAQGITAELTDAPVQGSAASPFAAAYQAPAQSQLAQWPCQIKLVPVKAPFFQGARLLIAADCTAYAYARMHQDFMRGRVTIIGCPKLDSVDYSEKLTEIIRNNDIRDITIVRMEVPCCGGLERAAINAMKNSGKFLPWQVVTISTDGRILD